MRSSNPILDAEVFTQGVDGSYSKPMTIQGTVNKSFILLSIVVAASMFTFFTAGSALSLGFTIGGAIGGLIAAIVTTFNKKIANITAPIYAAFEGLFLGGISAYFDAMYGGIALQAVMLTFGVFFCLLAAYKSGVIKATENFKMGIVAATGAIGLIYLVHMVMGFFGSGIGLIHSTGTFGIIFSLGVVIVAALNLVLDFDFIEQGAKYGAPKYMEWYAAFGLLVTLVWLYLEILKLLAKLAARRD